MSDEASDEDFSKFSDSDEYVMSSDSSDSNIEDDIDGAVPSSPQKSTAAIASRPTVRVRRVRVRCGLPRLGHAPASQHAHDQYTSPIAAIPDTSRQSRGTSHRRSVSEEVCVPAKRRRSRTLPHKRGARGHSAREPAEADFDFHWSNGDDFFPQVSVFPVTGRGITADFGLPQNAQECDYFLQYFDDELLHHIATETNQFHEQFAETLPQSHEREWHNVTANEMKVFFALTMLMPHSHKSVLYDYWNKHDVLNTPVFPKYMTRDRYRAILRYLHYANNETDKQNDDPVWRARHVLQNLKT